MEYPYPVTEETETGQLIDEINRTLAERNQHLCWFRSQRSTNRARVTVNAGIFPASIRTSVHGKECIHHLVSWEWCPRVGITSRSRQYQELAEAWSDYNSPQQANPQELMAAIDNAPDFNSEQAAIGESHGTLDILTDLTGDAGKIWAIHATCDDDARKLFSQISRRLGLSWERGARRFYIVGIDQLKRAYAEFERHGFVVALCMDAAQSINS